tara:strand:- start:1815 stop:2924 length:1110 start_codon:yes stop_codon:yes gene_type:complete
LTPLETKIRKRINASGPLPVSEFMNMALCDPELGYYKTRNPIGGEGDFITSPEISQVFGEIIGLWCAVMWQASGSATDVKLVELGPGRGTLMSDMLRAIHATAPDFASAIDVHLVETSPVLRGLQEEALKEHKVTWHENVESIPGGKILVVANEFFDALPIDQFVKTEDGWQERCVSLSPNDDTLTFATMPMRHPNDADFPSEIVAAPVNSVFEENVVGKEITGSLAGRIAQDGIAALILDYGHNQHGLGDTLQAMKSHQFHNPLAEIGEIDLTAHVDFAALDAASTEQGCIVHGPIFQGDFLSSLGIEQRAEILSANASVKQANLLTDGCRRLIASDGMGTLFKAMALTPKDSVIPAGFEKRHNGVCE